MSLSKSLFVLVSLSLFAACGESSPKPPVAEPVACGADAFLCGGRCCSNHKECIDDACVCVPQCAGKQCGSDGCGGSCGLCAETPVKLYCNDEGKCQESCVDIDFEICRRAEAECGLYAGIDQCTGETRTVQCGICDTAEYERCNEETNRCECIGETEAELCQQAEAECGSGTVIDRCGVARAIICPDTCKGKTECVDMKCQCIGETNEVLCARAGAECGGGTVIDKCDKPRAITCPDTCVAPESCYGMKCECHPKSDQALCAESETACGSRTFTDNCEAYRVVECPDTCPVGPGWSCEENSCVCTPESDATFCSRLGKNCGRVQARDNCGMPRMVAECGTGECPEGESCFENVCGAVGVPSNDACDGAHELVFVGTDVEGVSEVRFQADNSQATDSGTGTCRSTNIARDIVYWFEVKAVSSFVVEVTPLESVTFPNVYLRRACEDKGSEVSCRNASNSTKVTLDVPQLVPGTYYLWLDGYGAAADGPNRGTGKQSVTAVLTELASPAHDSCGVGEEERIELGAGEKIVVEGTTLAAATPSVADERCGIKGGDVYYGLTVPEGPNRRVNITAVTVADKAPKEYYLYYSPSIEVLEDCEEEPIACYAGNAYNASNGGPTESGVRLHNVAGGTQLHIRIGSTSALYGGPFMMTVEIADAIPNGSCEDATLLELGAGNTVTVRGDTTGAPEVGNVPCSTTPTDPAVDGPNVFYKVAPPSTGGPYNMTVAVNAPTESGLYPMVAIFSECGTTAFWGCGKRGASPYKSTSAIANNVTAPLYYIHVESFRSTAKRFEGTFDLTVSFVPRVAAPPANDTCAGASDTAYTIAPAADTGRFKITGTTAGSTNALDPVCGMGMTGGEVFYRFEVVDGPKQFFAYQKPTDANSFRALLYVLKDCGEEPYGGLCSRYDPTAINVKYQAYSLDSGTYYLVVDGAEHREGDFTVEGYLYPEAQTNDRCESAREIYIENLPFTKKLALDTSFAAHDGSTSCYQGEGRDLVWKLVLKDPSLQELTARFSKGVGMASPNVNAAFRRDCGSAEAPNEFFCVNNPSDAALQTVRRVEGGNEYYLWVDNFSSAQSGPMELELTSKASVIRTNDACSNALEFPMVDASGNSSIGGNTAEATPGDLAGCNESSTGADLVYQLTVDALSHVRFTLKPDTSSELIPSLYVRTGCASAVELACAFDTAKAKTVSAEVRDVPAGSTLYVFVDSATDRNEGPFTLSAAVETAAAPPANDSCSGLLTQTLGPSAPALHFAEQSTRMATNLYAGQCQGSAEAQKHSGGDLVYQFYAESRGRVTAALHKSTASGAFKPALYLRKGLCQVENPENELACISGTGAIVDLSTTVEEGLYQLFVDGVGGTRGAFDLDLSFVAAAPIADTCLSATPVALQVGQSSLSLSGNTQAASNNYSSRLLGLGSGPDVVYAIDTAEAALLTFRLEFAAANGTALLSLTPNCSGVASGEAETGAAKAPYGGPVTLTRNVEAGRRYYLWVDSEWPLSGPYRLSIESAAPTAPPANVACSQLGSPIAWDGNGATIEGSTFLGQSSAVTGTCGTMSGPELIYVVDIPPERPTRSLTATIRPGAHARSDVPLSLYLRTQCDSSAAVDQAACQLGSAVGTATAFVPITKAARYYLFVDSASPIGDDFVLDLSLGAPAPESCAEALPISLGADNTLVLKGDTRNVKGDIDNACPSTTAANKNPGRDLVYKLAVTAEQAATGRDLVASLTYANSAALATLFVRTGSCTTTTGELCERKTNSPASLVRVTNVQAKDYWIIIDSSSDASISSDFTLNLSVVATGAQPPAVSACAGATELALPLGPATFTGTTRGGFATDGTKCKSGTGQEAVYSLNLTHGSPGDDYLVDLIVAPREGSRFVPSAEFRDSCNASSSSKVCGTGTADLPAVALSVTVKSGTTYYLWVDSAAPGQEGDFLLNTVVRVAAPQPDTCAQTASYPLFPLATNGHSGVRGTLVANLTDDAQGSCQDPAQRAGGERIYAIELTQPSALFAALTVTDGASAALAHPALYLRQGACGDAQGELACAEGTAAKGTSIYIPSLEAGTYWLFIDSRSAAEVGPYSLTIERTAPVDLATNDQCGLDGALATVLTLDAQGRAHLEIPHGLEGAKHDFTGACGVMPGRDLVYRVDIEPGRTFTATVTPDGSAFRFAPALYVTTTCGDSGTQVACGVGALGQPISLTLAPLSEPRRYYLHVDAMEAEARGGFALDLSAASPLPTAPNDSCQGAELPAYTLSLVSGAAVATGTLEDAKNDATGSCAAMVGKDKVYSFTLTGEKRLVAAVYTTGFSPALYLRSACASAAEVAPEACDDGSSALVKDTAMLDLPSLAAGKYYLWIDTTVLEPRGEFWLEVSTFEKLSAPPNDRCPDAQELALTGPAPRTVHLDHLSQPSAYLSQAANDTTADCYATPGRDMVYRFRVEEGAPRQFSASLATNPHLSPALYLRAACDDKESWGRNGCVVSTTRGGSVTMNHPYLPPGDYWLWVDSPSAASTGAFSLDVTLREPYTLAKVPTMATCPEAVDLSPLFVGESAVVGNAVPAPERESRFSGTCNYMRGPEYIYKLSLGVAKKVTLSATSAEQVALYVRSSCGDPSSANERGCVDASLSGGAASLTLPSLGAGEYYLFVDFASATAQGLFQLTVALGAPTP